MGMHERMMKLATTPRTPSRTRVYAMRKHAMAAGALEKLAIRFRGYHDTNGAWETLIPWFGGHNAVTEANAKATFATGLSRDKLLGALHYARQTTAGKGGTPHVGTLHLDTKRGWYPSSFTPEGKAALRADGAESVPEMRAMVQEKASDMDALRDRLRRLAASPERDRLKSELGQHHRDLHDWVGSWATPNMVRTHLGAWRVARDDGTMLRAERFTAEPKTS